MILGCGDVGMRCAPLLARFATVLGASRSPDIAGLRKMKVRPVGWNLDARIPRKRNLTALAPWVIYLAPPPNTDNDDPRIKRFLTAFKGTRIAYVSTSGVYGNCDGALFDETRTPRPESDRGKRRVAAERRLRRAAKQGVRASILRAPGIYAADRLPLDRLQAGTPALRQEDDVYTNHIHADDLAHICIAALFRAKPGRVYHASDDSQMKMADYFDAVAAAFNLPKPPRLPAAELREQVSPALWSFMRESRRLKNERIKHELRVRLAYPTVHGGITAALNTGKLQSHHKPND